MLNRSDLADACYRMSTRGGYVLAFAKQVAVQFPDLTWAEFSNTLRDNGHGMCGYADEVVRRAFGR